MIVLQLILPSLCQWLWPSSLLLCWWLSSWSSGDEGEVFLSNFLLLYILFCFLSVFKSFLNLIILSIYIILFLCLFGFRVVWAPFEWLHLKGGLISWSWWMLNLYICVHTWRQQQQKQQLKNTKTILCNIHVAIEEDLLFHCTCRISCNS